MEDPFWDYAIEDYLRMTTDEERDERLRIHGPEVAQRLLAMLEDKIRLGFYKVGKQRCDMQKRTE